jgi:hypothetical protein
VAGTVRYFTAPCEFKVADAVETKADLPERFPQEEEEARTTSTTDTLRARTKSLLHELEAEGTVDSAHP